MATEGSRDTAVQEAINRALAAERDAAAAVAACERDAEALLDAARRQAQQIDRNAERRIAALHERHGRKRERAIAERLAEGMSPRPPPDPHLEEERIRGVVARLAATLTGGGE